MMTRAALRLSLFVAAIAVAAVAYACKGDEKAVKGPNRPNGAAHDTLSDLTLNEDGLSQVHIVVTLDDAVSMGLLNENPNMNANCDYVFPAVADGIRDVVSVIGVKGIVAWLDVDIDA